MQNFNNFQKTPYFFNPQPIEQFPQNVMQTPSLRQMPQQSMPQMPSGGYWGRRMQQMQQQQMPQMPPPANPQQTVYNASPQAPVNPANNPMIHPQQPRMQPMGRPKMIGNPQGLSSQPPMVKGK